MKGKKIINKIRCLRYIKEKFGKISQREMARRLGIGKTTVNRWSKELGLEVKKNSVNEDFFKKWTHDMSYILGYIFTDGNIAWNPKKSYRSLTITAAERDKDHLERIRLSLHSTKELLYSSLTKSYRLVVANRNICLDLMKFGVFPNKSLSVKFPDVPKKFLNDFIRGIIDGDGNVRYVNRKRSPYFEITISSGSKKFCDALAEKISSVLGIDARVRRIKNNLFVIQYSCQKGLNLAEWIYKDANIFLDRKFQQYDVAIKSKGGD